MESNMFCAEGVHKHRCLYEFRFYSEGRNSKEPYLAAETSLIDISGLLEVGNPDHALARGAAY